MVQHPLVLGPGRVCGPGVGRHRQLDLLVVSGLELVGSGLSKLTEITVRPWHVEHRIQFSITRGFLIVRPAHSMSMELVEHEERCGNSEGESVMLKWRPMAVPHQEVDQSGY